MGRGVIENGGSFLGKFGLRERSESGRSWVLLMKISENIRFCPYLSMPFSQNKASLFFPPIVPRFITFFDSQCKVDSKIKIDQY